MALKASNLELHLALTQGARNCFWMSLTQLLRNGSIECAIFSNWQWRWMCTTLVGRNNNVIYHWETKDRVIHIIVIKRLISWLFEHSNLIYWKAAITCNTILLTLLVIVTTSWHKLRRHCITMHISNNIICLWYSLVWFTIFRIKVTVVNQERYEAVVI